MTNTGIELEKLLYGDCSREGGLLAGLWDDRCCPDGELSERAWKMMPRIREVAKAAVFAERRYRIVFRNRYEPPPSGSDCFCLSPMDGGGPRFDICPPTHPGGEASMWRGDDSMDGGYSLVTGTWKDILGVFGVATEDPPSGDARSGGESGAGEVPETPPAGKRRRSRTDGGNVPEPNMVRLEAILRRGGTEWLALLHRYLQALRAEALSPIHGLLASLRFQGTGNGWFQDVVDACIGDETLEDFFDFAFLRIWGALWRESTWFHYVSLHRLRLVAHETFSLEFAQMVFLQVQSLPNHPMLEKALLAPFAGAGEKIDLCLGTDGASRAAQTIVRDFLPRGFEVDRQIQQLPCRVDAVLDAMSQRRHFQPHADPDSSAASPNPTLQDKREILRKVLERDVLGALERIAQTVSETWNHLLEDAEAKEAAAAHAPRPEETPFRRSLLTQLAGDGPAFPEVGDRLLACLDATGE